MDKNKIAYIKNELTKIWDDDDFVMGIIDGFDYDSELDEMIEFIDENKGNNLEPYKYTTASLNIMYGEGNWEKGQLIEWVEDGEEDA